MPLKFETPPPGQSRGPLTPEDVAALIAHTGEWARIDVPGSQQSLVNRARSIRNGRGECDGHQWETAVRKVDGTHALFVRHIAALEK